jgi:DUF1009 family protein
VARPVGRGLFVTQPLEQLGIIAGGGEYPLLLARSARQQGVKKIVAAAFDGETQPMLSPLVDHIEWVKLGQLNKLIQTFTEHGIRHCVMAGSLAPSNLFKDIRLDFRMIAVAARLKVRNAHTIFGAVAEELAKDGVMLLDARAFLGEHVPQAGIIAGRKLSTEQQDDVDYGWKIAKAASSLEIGQTVVVKNGTVLAVEGFEGTDECIKRGGALAGDSGGATVVKVSKPNHDFRFDVPCIGTKTIAVCAAAKISVLAVEAGKTLLLDREKVVTAANDAGIKMVAMAE